MYKIFTIAVLVFVFLAGFNARHKTKIYTNQAMIEGLDDHNSINFNDEDAIFAAVIDSLPKKINVHPTENYYYFWFYHKGNLVRGNLRFAYDHRDKGELPFAYYYDVFGQEGRDRKVHYKVYTRSKQFSLKRISAQKYIMKYKSKKITVNLITPKSDYTPQKDEVLIGDMMDEAGIVFAFVFNHRTNNFYYVMDRTREYEFQYNISKHLSVGARSGFVYYLRGDDMVLVGVNADNVRRNTFFDGPFDQLPEHALEKADFKSLVIKVYPNLKEKINSHGQYTDGSSMRVAIDNYIDYKTLDVFSSLNNCPARFDEMQCVQGFINTVDH